jgi:hypothetical protein
MMLRDLKEGESLCPWQKDWQSIGLRAKSPVINKTNKTYITGKG